VLGDVDQGYPLLDGVLNIGRALLRPKWWA